MAEKWAIVEQSTVVELFDTKPIRHPSIDVRDVSHVDGIQVGWIDNGDGTYGPKPNPRTYGNVRAEANAALDNTMPVPIRCYEFGVPVPSEWVNYRNTLRQLRDAPTDGDPNTQVPEMPPWPSGIGPPPIQITGAAPNSMQAGGKTTPMKFQFGF